MQVIDTRFGVNKTVLVQFGRYRNGQLALLLLTDEGEPWLDATSAIIAHVPPGCVAVKNWSENEGISELLLQASVIEGNVVPGASSGYVVVPIYRLTATALQAAEAHI